MLKQGSVDGDSGDANTKISDRFTNRRQNGIGGDTGGPASARSGNR